MRWRCHIDTTWKKANRCCCICIRVSRERPFTFQLNYSPVSWQTTGTTATSITKQKKTPKECAYIVLFCLIYSIYLSWLSVQIGSLKLIYSTNQTKIEKYKWLKRKQNANTLVESLTFKGLEFKARGGKCSSPWRSSYSLRVTDEKNLFWAFENKIIFKRIFPAGLTSRQLCSRRSSCFHNRALSHLGVWNPADHKHLCPVDVYMLSISSAILKKLADEAMLFLRRKRKNTVFSCSFSSW